jgi:S-formylglutathione hydrolase FrmB
VDEDVFAHASKAVRMQNSPYQYIFRLPPAVQIPQFFLAAGALDSADVTTAEQFRQMLQTRDPNVPLDIVPGGGHQAAVWRSSIAEMLPWMTNQQAVAVQHITANEENAAKAIAMQKAKAAPRLR